MRSRTAPRFAALAAAATFVLAACSTAGAVPGSDPRTLNIGQIQDISSWDPGQGHVGPKLAAFQLAYDTLILRNPDGSSSPMLATTWGYTDDAKTTFSLDLRHDVTFSDGARLDANAVKANLDHFRTANGPQAIQLADVSDVRLVDADTVEIHLARPSPALEFYLSQAAGTMGSPAQLGTPAMSRTPVGSGPYVMDPVASVAGNQYVFVAREDYWNLGLQHWDRIVLKILSDPTARVNALVSGQVDAASLEPRTVAQAENAGKEVVNWDAQWMGLLLFDRAGQVNRALGDVRVRQAINYAFDRETNLAGAVNGSGSVTSQVFGKDSTAYAPSLDGYYPYDPERARRLLAEAGYPDGFTLTIPLAATLAHFAPFIVQPLADIGITVQIVSVPVQNYQAELGSGKYAAAWWVLPQAPTWVAVQQLLAPKTLYNPFGSVDPELQRMIDAVRAGGPDAGDKAKAMARYVTENAWFAPWFRVGSSYGIDPRKVRVQPQAGQAVPAIYGYAPVA